MYEQAVYDDPERILAIMARVEAEEERTARKARMDRDVKEEAERERKGRMSNGISTGEGEAGGSTPSTPGGADAKPSKEKKTKKQGPGQAAKNMSEDARARLSNQTAMRSVGGPSRYSWLSGGVGAARPVSTPGTPSPLGPADGLNTSLKGLPGAKVPTSTWVKPQAVSPRFGFYAAETWSSGWHDVTSGCDPRNARCCWGGVGRQTRIRTGDDSGCGLCFGEGTGNGGWERDGDEGAPEELCAGESVAMCTYAIRTALAAWYNRNHFRRLSA